MELKTGRTHQIRVSQPSRASAVRRRQVRRLRAQQAAREGRGLKGMFLHAAKLAFRHPLTDQADRTACRCLPNWMVSLPSSNKPGSANMDKEAPRRFELIVFDWDGTLMDSAAAIVQAIQASQRRSGPPPPPGHSRAVTCDRPASPGRAAPRSAGFRPNPITRRWWSATATTIRSSDHELTSV